MNIATKEPCRCVDCGQAFKLKKAKLPDNLNDPNTRSGELQEESQF